MKKGFIIHVIIIWFVSIPLVSAQQDLFKWRIGGGAGVMMYYGDLNQRVFAPVQPLLDLDPDYLSYQLSAERSLSKGTSLKLSFTKGRFIANDRAIDNNGNLLTDNTNFNRSLNSLTLINDLSLSYYFYTDNDRIFGKRAFVSPFFSLGAGITHYVVYGDLFGAGGTRYYYWGDNTIRTLAETDPLSATAVVVNQDGVFETNLSELETETSYLPYTISFPLSAGLKFRLGNRLNLNLEYSVRYTLTDHIDDVSGDFRTIYDSPLQEYASNPAGIAGTMRGNSSKLSDMWSFSSLTLQYNFGKRKSTYRPPYIYSSAKKGAIAEETKGGYEPWISEKKADVIKEITVAAAVKGDNVVVTDSNKITGKLVLPEQKFTDTLQFVTDSLFTEVYPVDTLIREDMERMENLNDSIVISRDSSMISNPFLLKSRDPLVVKRDSVALYVVTKEPDLYAVQTEQPADSILNASSDQLFTSGSRQVRMFTPFNPMEGVADTSFKIGEESQFNDYIMAPQKSFSVQQAEIAPPAVMAEQDAEKILLQERLNMEIEKSQFYHDQVIFMRELMLSLNMKDTLVVNPGVSASLIDTLKVADQAPVVKSLPAAGDSLVIKSDPVSDYFIAQKRAETTEKAEVIEKSGSGGQQLEYMAEMGLLKQRIQTLENQISVWVSRSGNIVDTVEVAPKYEIPGTELFFETGSTELSPTASILLKKISDYLISDTEGELLIKGYSDVTGDADRNLELSMKRAETAKKYFLDKGIEESRIRVEYFGADLNYQGDLLRYGRRVEIIILK